MQPTQNPTRTHPAAAIQVLLLAGALLVSLLFFLDVSVAEEEGEPAKAPVGEDAAPATGERAPKADAPEKPAPEDLPETLWDLLREQYDKNGDGIVLKDEYTRSDKAFAASDRNRDGVLTSADYRGPRPGMGGPHMRRGPGRRIKRRYRKRNGRR